MNLDQFKTRQSFGDGIAPPITVSELPALTKQQIAVETEEELDEEAF